MELKVACNRLLSEIGLTGCVFSGGALKRFVETGFITDSAEKSNPYLKHPIRTALLTFAVGLFSVQFVNFLQEKLIDSSINLPKASSEIIIVQPANKIICHHCSWGGGASGGAINKANSLLSIKGADK